MTSLSTLLRNVSFESRRTRLEAIFGGSLIVVLWTLIRHFTNGVNFDVVGQIGLADQWTHGLHSGAQVGPTNYLLKMPLYIVVNAFGFLSPHARILLLALVFNLATFLLLFVLFEKILQLIGVSVRSWLYISMLWLASISGSVYWVDYANSRNLETVGGILLLYLSLSLFKAPNWQNCGWIMLAASVVFFADPLQVYVIALPIALYTIVHWLFQRTRTNFLQAAYLLVAAASAYIASKLLFILAAAVLPVSFLAVPSPVPALTVANALASAKAAGISTLKIFDSYFFKLPITPNAVRELLNAIVLGAIIVLLVRLLIRKPNHSSTRNLLLTIIAVDYAVYAASGQALQWETSRYLVMVPLVSLLIVSIWGDLLTRRKKGFLQASWLAAIAVSCVLLLGALAISWPKHYSKDVFISSTVVFLKQHGYNYAVSSREVGIPASYFAGRTPTVLPTLCAPDHTLHISKLFYDKAAFRGLRALTEDVPVILEPSGIKYGNTYCSKNDVIAQYGQPKQELDVPGVGRAEVYPAKQLKLTD